MLLLQNKVRPYRVPKRRVGFINEESEGESDIEEAIESVIVRSGQVVSSNLEKRLDESHMSNHERASNTPETDPRYEEQRKLKQKYFLLKEEIRKETENQSEHFDNEDLSTRHIESTKKIKTMWESIINKYSAFDEDNQGDLINLNSLSIEEDTGHLDNLDYRMNKDMWTRNLSCEEDEDDCDYEFESGSGNFNLDPINLLNLTPLRSKKTTRTHTRAPSKSPSISFQKDYKSRPVNPVHPKYKWLDTTDSESESDYESEEEGQRIMDGVRKGSEGRKKLPSSPKPQSLNHQDPYHHQQPPSCQPSCESQYPLEYHLEDLYDYREPKHQLQLTQLPSPLHEREIRPPQYQQQNTTEQFPPVCPQLQKKAEALAQQLPTPTESVSSDCCHSVESDKQDVVVAQSCERNRRSNEQLSLQSDVGAQSNTPAPTRDHSLPVTRPLIKNGSKTQSMKKSPAKTPELSQLTKLFSPLSSTHTPVEHLSVLRTELSHSNSEEQKLTNDPICLLSAKPTPRPSKPQSPYSARLIPKKTPLPSESLRNDPLMLLTPSRKGRTSSGSRTLGMCTDNVNMLDTSFISEKKKIDVVNPEKEVGPPIFPQLASTEFGPNKRVIEDNVFKVRSVLEEPTSRKDKAKVIIIDSDDDEEDQEVVSSSPLLSFSEKDEHPFKRPKFPVSGLASTTSSKRSSLNPSTSSFTTPYKYSMPAIAKSNPSTIFRKHATPIRSSLSTPGSRSRTTLRTPIKRSSVLSSSFSLTKSTTSEFPSREPSRAGSRPPSRSSSMTRLQAGGTGSDPLNLLTPSRSKRFRPV